MIKKYYVLFRQPYNDGGMVQGFSSNKEFLENAIKNLYNKYEYEIIEVYDGYLAII